MTPHTANKNIMRRALLFSTLTLLLAATLFSCEKYIDQTNPGLRNVFGEWDWIMSTGGIAGDTISASEVENSVWLSYDEEGNYIKFVNDKGAEYLKYYFVNKGSILSSITLGQIEYSNGVLQSVKMPHHDTLLLIDELNDGYAHYYVRKK